MSQSLLRTHISLPLLDATFPDTIQKWREDCSGWRDPEPQRMPTVLGEGVYVRAECMLRLELGEVSVCERLMRGVCAVTNFPERSGLFLSSLSPVVSEETLARVHTMVLAVDSTLLS